MIVEARPPEIQPSYDPGLTQKYTGVLKRFINRDGQFNVRRADVSWRDIHPYMVLISMPWLSFFAIVLSVFLFVNLIFASAYMAVGAEHIKSAVAATEAETFLNLFFFSAHTLTTVGYGNMYPEGPDANAISAVEALAGLMTFAIVTGLVFGRFSKPSARFGFSDSMVVAPYRDGLSLQFRVVNRRANNLIDVQARMLLMTVHASNGGLQRRYTPLELERDQILFFPLPWTVVHPINESSPVYGKTAEELEEMQAEVMIVVRGFDDTFGQTVQARYSYRYDEIVWGAKFVAAFEQVCSDNLIVQLDKIGLIEQASLPRPS